MLNSRHLKIILPLLVLSMGAVAAWAIVASRPEIIPQSPHTDIPTVTVMHMQPQTLKLTVHSQGVVTPRHELDLIPEVAGKIIKLHPHLVAGGFFAHNDVLFEIDPRDYDYAIVQAQALVLEAKRLLAMEEAQAEQAHTEWEALGEGAPSALAMRQPQLAEARAKLQAAITALQQAQLKRSRCSIRAPFTGSVQSKNVALGQVVQAGEKLAHLYATDVAEVRLPIATDELAFLDLVVGGGLSQQKKSMAMPKVVLSAEFAGQQQAWQGRIVRTEGQLDATTGVMYLVAEVTNPFNQAGQPLLNGLFVQAEVQGKEIQEVFVLPQIALNAAHEVLLVNAQQKLHIQPVKILRTEAERVLIQAGLKAGDQVVLSGVNMPIEGMAVQMAAQPALTFKQP